jgi:predicted alpha/beta hydrolase family esterase
MPKRVIIVHGWHDSPEGSWLPWLKAELTSRGFEVVVPAMPHPETPDIRSWTSALAKAVGTIDKEMYFIGHSIGCQTIVRYLESSAKAEGLLSAPVPARSVGGILFVAGWFMLTNLSEEEQSIANSWLTTPIDFAAVRKYVRKSTAILSDNDPYVPLEKNRTIFQEQLGSQIIIVSDKGHISGEEGYTKLPEALDAFLTLSAYT